MNNETSNSHSTIPSSNGREERIVFTEEETFHPCRSEFEDEGVLPEQPEAQEPAHENNHQERMEEAHPNSSTLSTIKRNSEQSHQSCHSNNRARRSSLELRKLPANILLSNHSEGTDIREDDSSQGGLMDRLRGTSSKSRGGSETSKSVTTFTHAESSILRRTCLNSKFNLRTQMMLSFGLVSAFAILLVVTVCIAVSIMSGNEVNQLTHQSFDDLVRSKEGTFARYLAESLTLRLLPSDLVQVVHEATQDRFAGYPTFEDDSQVPFFDTISKTNRYPIKGRPLPLDWQMPPGGNVNDETQQEHVQHRWPWYQTGAPLSTESAHYFIQGQCDPDVTDLKGHTYWPGCSDNHNNMTSGGVIAPSPTNDQVYRKASDLGPLLKALYEFHLDVKELGIFFANGGSGATIAFPHYQLNTSTTYESIGCNWLLEPHPYDPSRYIGSMEDHARCELNGIHVKDAKLSTRLYNPMDRAWCRNQALNPDKIMSFGPYQSAWHEREWLMSIGRAVYDRVTRDFVGCISIDYVLDSVTAAISESIISANSVVSLVRWDEMGTVVASSAWNMSEASRNVMVEEIHIGVSQSGFDRFKNLVNFDEHWDPQDVRRTFESFHVQEDGFSVTAYPVPPPPDEYDPSYRPEFLAISSVSDRDIHQEVESVSDAVDDTVSGLISLSLVVGLIGFGAIILFIFIVSHAITLPLNYMNDVSSDIVNTFGSHKEEGIEMTHTTLESRCSPKTELSDVVKQFQKMVSRFSGSAMARSMQVNVHEIDNRFTVDEQAAKLYFSRCDADFVYNFEEPVAKQKEEKRRGKLVHVPSRVHYGSVINDGTASEATAFRTSDVELGGTRMTSPLFFWIVALIVTPLLITTISISVYATYSISQGLFDIIDEAQTQYIWLNQYALGIFCNLRANYGALTMTQAIRDNFLLTRFSTWLLFGGIERIDSFTEMFGGTNECKGFSNVKECEAYSLFSCDCAWGDPFLREGTCDSFDHDTSSRHTQKLIFFGLAEDVMPDGDRIESTYPDLAYSEESTVWWPNNISSSDIPGAEKGALAAGYETTYDRLRVMSAMPIFQTLYNADKGKSTYVASNIFFEADGLSVGYTGCDVAHLKLAGWFSTKENGASDIRPELCPLGKYGFDPRCRGWYDTGRKLALQNNTGLYVTPPYHFAGKDNFFGQTCTSPVIDPFTGEHVGQTLVDFASTTIFEALHKNNTPLASGGFPIVITGLSDSFGADTVIGPGFSLIDGSSAPIGDVVLPFDDTCPSADCKHRTEFEIIRSKMKNGERDSAQFMRAMEDGSSETVHMAFSPIWAKIVVPVNASDYSRGVNVSEFLVYSLALVEPEESMVAPFSDVESEVHKQIYIAVVVLAFVIFFSTALIIYITNRITISMTEPMIYLLKLIIHINQTHVDGTPPDVEVDQTYGSREIVNVVETMETLYRIVRTANVAYFHGDVEKAYYVLSDAARLFKRLENSKAEGVANNNLGNTMLAFYRTIEDTGVEQVCGFNKREVIRKGMGYYHRAIQLGEKAYDVFYEEEGWSPSCLEFMQHLSNRYFNRAMFLLTVKGGHERPAELEELGLRDLQITTDMDVEIVDQGTEVGWDVRGADKLFDVFLSRIRGHLLLLEMGYEDKWEIDEGLDNAFAVVKKELLLSNPGSSPLFKEFCPAGRMQQIETELVRYKVLKGELSCAAKIAIRMLVEDERTLQGAQLKAVEVLVMYFKDVLESGGAEPNASAVQALEDLEEYQSWLQHASDERDRCHSEVDWQGEMLPESFKKSMRRIQCDSESEARVEPTEREMTMMRMSSLRASTRGDVTMEIF